jgi:hypothetical protein
MIWVEAKLTLKIFVSVALLAVSTFGIQLPGYAGGDTVYRVAKGTSLFTCPGTLFESHFTHGNVQSWGAHLTLVCLRRPNQARWVWYSGVNCDVSKDPKGLCHGKQDLPIEVKTTDFSDVSPSQRGKRIRNDYRFPKAILGEFCNLISQEEIDINNPQNRYSLPVWRCEKYSKFGETQMSTFGTAGMMTIVSFYHPLFNFQYMSSGFMGGLSSYGRLEL